MGTIAQPAPVAVTVAQAAEGDTIGRARSATERHATTFAFACRLLPDGIRDDVYLLYLVFRTLDDLVDDHAPDAAARVQAVADWGNATSGEATAETKVLDRLARRYPLPRWAIHEFCAGMRQDLGHEPFATEHDVDRYCYRVAGTVGIVMTSLLGTTNQADAQAAAASLGMAMQRTNILRDIDEDAAAGRLYISQEARRRYGEPFDPGRRSQLVRAQIAHADELYEDGLAGIGTLVQGRAAITLAATLYREILREIERGGLDRPGRAVVPSHRKLLTILRAVISGR